MAFDIKRAVGRTTGRANVHKFKRCSRCRELVLSSLFHKSKAQRDGLQAVCIPCQKDQKKELRDRRRAAEC